MEILTGSGTLGEMSLSWAGATDVGLKRPDNQDSFLAAPPFFLVADGMGGHAGGKQASATLLGALRPFTGRKLGFEKVHRLLATACHEVMDLADSNMDYSISPPGTTLSGLVFLEAEISEQGAPPPPPRPPQPEEPPQPPQPEEPAEQTFSDASDTDLDSRSPSLLVLNVGDSRSYELKEGLLRKITRDHSQVEEMVEAGLIPREMASNMPNRSVITRAVGAGQETLPEIDTWRFPLRGSCRYLICSDGLHAMVSDGVIGHILSAKAKPEEAVKSLVQEAISHGGGDNVTVIVVDISSEAGASGAGGENETR